MSVAATIPASASICAAQRRFAFQQRGEIEPAGRRDRDPLGLRELRLQVHQRAERAHGAGERRQDFGQRDLAERRRPVLDEDAVEAPSAD